MYSDSSKTRGQKMQPHLTLQRKEYYACVSEKINIKKWRQFCNLNKKNLQANFEWYLDETFMTRIIY